MRELADKKLQITLALSLHASSQEKRLELMPIANKYEIHEVIEACRYYFEQTGRRVTFEYSLVGGVNDTDEDVRRLADLIHGMNCHVNLIPVNPIKERSYVQPDHEAILNFKNRLEKMRLTLQLEGNGQGYRRCMRTAAQTLYQPCRKVGSREDEDVFHDAHRAATEMNQDYMFTSETAVGNLPNLF